MRDLLDAGTYAIRWRRPADVHIVVSQEAAAAYAPTALPFCEDLSQVVVFQALPASLRREPNPDLPNQERGFDLLALPAKDPSRALNAVVVPFHDGRATFAKLAGDVHFLLSTGFSGCVFQLYKDEKGDYYGVHAYKGMQKDTTTDMATAAAQARWELVFEWKSKGAGTADMLHIPALMPTLLLVHLKLLRGALFCPLNCCLV